MKKNKNSLALFIIITLLLAACGGPTADPSATPQANAPAQAEEPQTAESTGEPAAEQAALPIGLLLPFSGQFSWVGDNAQPVINMIVDEVNQSGGIGGSPIELQQGDSEGAPETGLPAAEKLIEEDNILALLGPTSLLFPGLEAVIIENSLPMVSPTAGTIDLDQAGTDYFYRTVPSDSLGGRVIARAVSDPNTYLEGEEAQRVLLLIDEDPAFISFQGPIEQGMADFGAALSGTVTYVSSQAGYQAVLEEALSADPQIIILVGPPDDTALLMQTAADNGYQGGWFVTQDQTNPEYIELIGGQLANELYGIEEVPDDSAAERLAAFEEQLMAYDGTEPQIFASSSYDAANVLFLAMTRAALIDGQISRSTINDNIPLVANPGEGKVEVYSYSEGKEALENGQEINYVGLNGAIDFDEYGNVTSPFGIFHVHDGQWQMISIVAAQAAR